jgi:hypothetical protein
MYDSNRTQLADNYDALKDEIFKIQQTISKSQTTSPLTINSSQPEADPFATTNNTNTTNNTTNTNVTNVDWSNAFDQTTNNTTLNDPFASFSAPATNESSAALFNDSNDPFASAVVVAKPTSDFDDAWSGSGTSSANPTKTSNPVASFDDAFGPSASTNNDNWVASGATSNGDSNWAAFDDGILRVHRFFARFFSHFYLLYFKACLYLNFILSGFIILILVFTKQF